MTRRNHEKIYILESNISDPIMRVPNDSGYSIKIVDQEISLPGNIEKEVSVNWEKFKNKNSGIAEDKTTFFYSSYNKFENCDYVFPEKFRYVQAFGRSNEFDKYACLVASNNLTALSSLCLILTSDNKMIFGVKKNMNNKISGFSGYMNNAFVAGDKMDIYKYLTTTIRDELNISEEDITSIVRIGQTYSPNILDSKNLLNNKVYNNIFIIKLNISSKNVLADFKITYQFNDLIEVNCTSNEIIKFVRANENNMSIHCVAAICNYITYTDGDHIANGLRESLKTQVISKVECKEGIDKTTNILKKIDIFRWGLIGNRKIKDQSIAPYMWKVLFEHINFPVNYFILAEDNQEEVEKFINNHLNDNRFIGCNVARPWKNLTYTYCDDVDKNIEKFDVINTLVSKAGYLKGYNTDGLGLINAINQKVCLREKIVLIMGAGGAAQTLPLYLNECNIKKAYICDIEDKKSTQLVQKFIDNFSETKITLESITHDEIKGLIKDVDVVINATPCGMIGFNEEIAFDKRNLQEMKQEVLVVEMVYNPCLTPLLNAALNKYETCDGINMLVEQAAISFYHGFGFVLSDKTKKIMREAAMVALNEI